MEEAISLNRQPSPRKRRLLVVACVVGFLVVGSLVIFFMLRALQTSHRPLKVVCSDESVTAAAALILDNNISGLGAVAGEIQQKPSYQDDIDCSYIVARYGIMSAQPELAQKELNNITSLQASGAHYRSLYGAVPVSTDNLKSLLDTLRANTSTQKQQQDESKASLMQVEGQ